MLESGCGDVPRVNGGGGIEEEIRGKKTREGKHGHVSVVETSSPYSGNAHRPFAGYIHNTAIVHHWDEERVVRGQGGGALT